MSQDNHKYSTLNPQLFVAPLDLEVGETQREGRKEAEGKEKEEIRIDFCGCFQAKKKLLLQNWKFASLN